MKYLQKIGKSLMLPVAVLPICGILMGIGYLLCPASMQGKEVVGAVAKLGYFLTKAGGAIIDNMALLFVIGVSMGMSDDNHGSSCLAGLVSWLVVTTLLSTAVLKTIAPGAMANEVTALAFDKIKNPFIGMLCGIIGSESYNRFKCMKLPDIFAFFSGRRFVAIVTMLISLATCFVLAFVWPLLFNLLVFIGQKIIDMKGIGAGIYAFLNRLLIPTGLHHALNNVFWFDTIGIGDLTKFWSGSDGTGLNWSLGMYMSGFFPPIMFGIPGAALAMYRCAKDRKKARGILVSVAACAFICGVTEPFEFLFMFTAFPLFVVYAVLFGIFSVITYFTGFRAGFSFSAGATDLLFSASLPAAKNTWMIIPLGILSFVLFYVVFRFMIIKFDLKTPGREGDSEIAAPETAVPSNVSSDDKYAVMASRILVAVGGSANVCSVDCCATRLRFELADNSLVNAAAAKAAGAMGAINIGKTAAQIIVGVTVQQVCDELKKQLASAPAAAEIKAAPTPYKPAPQAVAPKAQSVHRKVRHGERIVFSESGSAQFEYVIKDKVGMHARPAGELAKLMKGFDCTVTVSANGKSGSAKSIIELMSLGIAHGTTVTVSAEGSGAVQAIEKAKSFFAQKL